jgi:hypothetical protein
MEHVEVSFTQDELSAVRGALLSVIDDIASPVIDSALFKMRDALATLAKDAEGLYA